MTVAQLDVALDRPMPQSPDAERAVLGSILTNANAFYRVIATIGTEDFFKDAHRTIFTAMRRLAEESREIDLLTVKEELSKRGWMEQAGGGAYVSSLTDAPPDVANVERYARIVKEKSTLRRLIVMGNSVMRAALDAPGEPADVLSIAENSAIPDRGGSPRPPAQRLYSIGVFSLEMSKEQIGLRMLSSESGVSNHLIRAGMLSERNWRDLAEASARLAKAKIYIDDTPGIDVMEMRAKERRLQIETTLHIIIVSY